MANKSLKKMSIDSEGDKKSSVDQESTMKTTVTPIMLDFTGLNPPSQPREKEDYLKQLIDAETAANSLANSFATQGHKTTQESTLQLHPNSDMSGFLVCKCRASHCQSPNLFENIKNSTTCVFGNFDFDQILTDAGCITKSSAILSKSVYSSQGYKKGESDTLNTNYRPFVTPKSTSLTSGMEEGVSKQHADVHASTLQIRGTEVADNSGTSSEPHY